MKYIRVIALPWSIEFLRALNLSAELTMPSQGVQFGKNGKIKKNADWSGNVWTFRPEKYVLPPDPPQR